MFESVIAYILNKYLSGYIGELDYKNLQLGLFSGKIELKNVKIQPSALYQFDIPIEVKCGKIGKLEINISYTNIMSQPAIAKVEDLFILLGPFEDKKYDPKRIEELYVAHKRKELLETEKIERAQIFDPKEKGLTERVQDSIINNIQIYVENVHIRYEDKYSIKNKVVSFGLYFRSFRAETVDEYGKPNFLNADAKIIYKLGILSGFNFYWNCGEKTDTLISTNLDEKTENWAAILKESIKTGSIFGVPFGKFLEKNLDLETRLVLRRSYNQEDFKAPKIIFQSLVSSIDFVFQRHQYKNIFEVIDYYSMLNINKQFVKYRPKQSVKENRKEWWKYALTSIAETKWRSFQFDRMKNHFQSYKQYVKKYEMKLRLKCQDQDLSAADAKYLDLLENNLKLESILDARFYCKERIKADIECGKIKMKNTKGLLSQADKEKVKAMMKESGGDEVVESKQSFDGRPLEYVEFRLILNFPHISLKFKNHGYDILKLNFTDILTRVEVKPVANSIYFLINTRSIDIDGVYYKNSLSEANTRLVPIVRSQCSSNSSSSSKITADLLASEKENDVLFTFCFETNPIGIENAEFSIRAYIHSLEIIYEKTTINELLRFIKTDLIDFEEVRKIKDVWSKAGVSYAVESHKQFHIDAKLSSPYFVIPSKGTCLEPCDLLICYLGITEIKSELQPKRKTFSPKDIYDLEKNFYDRLSLNVSEVQVIYINSGIDWRGYLKNSEKDAYKYHILYPVSTENTLSLSINPNFKKLPMFKIDAKCTSIFINLSDKKILSLFSFIFEFKNNLPQLPSSSAAAAAAAAGVVPVAAATTPSAAVSPSSSHTVAPPPAKAGPPRKATTDGDFIKNNKFTVIESKGLIIEEADDEWEGAFRLPTQINGNPIPNYPKVSLAFAIKEFVIALKSTEKSTDVEYDESEYLKFLFDNIKLDFAVTKFGSACKAALGNLKLIDSLHKKADGTSTEILSSPTCTDLIKLWFRQVEPETPNFKSLYQSILVNLLFDCDTLQVVCHRAAIVHFLHFAKGITDNLNIADKTSVPESEKKPSVDAKPSNTTAAAITPATTPTVCHDVCQLNIMAKMDNFSWKMYDTNFMFGDMNVKGLSLTYNLKGIKTELKVQLSEIFMNYSGAAIGTVTKVDKYVINDFYRQIIACTADENKTNFFDFSLSLYDTTNLSPTIDKKQFKDSIQLSVGEIKIIALLKFINELADFFEPIINPLPTITEQVREQAIEAVNAVKNRMQETESEGKQIYLSVDIKSPKVIIPQNSGSSNAFLVDLGNLYVKNVFRCSDLRNDLTVDDIELKLKNVEINRVVITQSESGSYIPLIREQVVDKISLSASVIRLIKGENFVCLVQGGVCGENLPADIDIGVQITKLNSTFSLKSARLLFAILEQNLNEGIDPNKEEVDAASTSQTQATEIALKEDKSKTSVESTTLTSTSTSTRPTLKISIELSEIELIIVDYVKLEKALSLQRSASSTYTANSSYTSNGSPTQQQQQVALTRVNFSDFRIKEIAFKYVKLENNCWFAELDMKELVLNDVRPNCNLAVKEMFIPLKKDTKVMTLKYVVDAENNAKLRFELGDIQINLCLPYILKLYQMAMDAIGTGNNADSSDTTKATDQVKKPVKNIQNTAAKMKPIAADLQTMSEGKTQEKAKADSSLKVNGEIRLPQVILFAEPEKKNSKVLLMNTEIRLKFESEKGNTSLKIALSKLGMRLGEYGNLEKKGIDFLTPCKAELEMTQKLGQKVPYYTTRIKCLNLNMTPTLYEVVMGVVNTINMSGTEKQVEEIKKQRLLEDAEPFAIRNDDRNNYLVNNTDVDVLVDDEAMASIPINNRKESMKVPEEPAKTPETVTKVLEALDLKINELRITFCEETAVELQPLAVVKLTLDGRVANWTKNLHVKADLTLEASYYNDYLSNWEPLIEKVMHREDEYRPWMLNIWFAMEPGSVLQPPKTNEKLKMVEFPPKDLDYTVLENELSGGGNSAHYDPQATVSLHSVNQIAPLDANLFSSSSSESINKLHTPVAAQTTASYILVESQDILNLNVTPSAYKVIMYLAQLTAGSKKEEIVENKNKPALKINNFMGIKSEIWVADELPLKDENALHFIVHREKARDLNRDLSLTNALLSEQDTYLSANESTVTMDSIVPVGRSNSRGDLSPQIARLFDNTQKSQIDSVFDDRYKIQVELEGYERLKLSIKTDGAYYVPIHKKHENENQPNLDNTKYYIAYRVRTLYGRQKIVFSSPLQIENETKVNLSILIEVTDEMLAEKEKWNIAENHIITIPDQQHQESAAAPSSSNLANIAAATTHEVKYTKYMILFDLQPGKIYYVPIIYAYNVSLFTTPDYTKYAPSKVFAYKAYNFRFAGSDDLVCRRFDTNVANSSINSSGGDDDTRNFELIRQLAVNVGAHKHRMMSMNANYRVLLYAPITIINNLPFNVRIDIDEKQANSKIIECGHSMNIYLPKSTLKGCKLHVIEYLESSWVGNLDLKELAESAIENSVVPMDLSQNLNTMYISNKHLSIHVSHKKPNEYSLYSPYWIFNKTGKALQIKASGSQKIFDIPDDAILLFDFKRPGAKNKAKLAIKEYEFSNSFGLDAVGTHGVVECKENTKTPYSFLMRTTMSNSSRTKLITFAPYMSIINELNEPISIAECPPRGKPYNWRTLAPSKVDAFWSEYYDFQHLNLRIKNRADKISQHFPLENPSHFVLEMKDRQREETPTSEQQPAEFGLDISTAENNTPATTSEPDKFYTVLISGGSSNPVTLVIRKYQYGDAVAKLVNLCDDMVVQIKTDSDAKTLRTLNPCRSMFFIWPELIKSKRDLRWSVDGAIGNEFRPVHVANSGVDNVALKFQNASSSISPDDVSTDDYGDDNHDSQRVVIADSSAYRRKDDAQNTLITRAGKNKNKHKKALEKPIETTRTVYSVSYMDGSQRVILFTTDPKFTELTRKEASTMEIFVSFYGMEVSIINNVNMEIALVAITGSTAYWSIETKVDGRSTITKTFADEYNEWLERNYRNYLLSLKDKAISNSSNNLEEISIDGRLKVNFRTMTIEVPERGKLIRKWEAGLGAQYRVSRNMFSLKSYVYNIQIDNQLPDAYFPITLYKAPLKMSELRVKEFIPFMDFSLFTEQQEVLQIYRYFDVVLQELYLKVDKGFLLSLKDWYDDALDTKSKDSTATDATDLRPHPSVQSLLIKIDKDPKLIEYIEADLKLIKEIMEYADKSGTVKQSSQILFDFFRLSPIVCNLSFSVNGTAHTDNKPIAVGGAEIIGKFFLESIGSTVTEFKDVKFRFALFQKLHETKTWDELYASLFDHYKMQALRQAYVLLFGLDVIGNPFGLVSDFSEGLTSLFYEPLIGYISKPNEVKELHMGQKVRDTVNKTISSAAGSASLITGSIGRVLATCTLDADFKRRRQYKLSNVSTMSVKDSFAIAGKGIIAGVIQGLTGTVTSPIKEAKNVRGAFKGIGKGFLGFFAKPLSSVFDGVSMTFDGLKRFSQSGSEVVHHTRLPRHLIKKIPILLYSEYQSRGYEILRDLQNDDIAVNESYWAHLFLTKGQKQILLLITDANIYHLKKTFTQILKKWELTEPLIPLNNTTLSKAKQQTEAVNQKSKRSVASTAAASTNADAQQQAPQIEFYTLEAVITTKNPIDRTKVKQETRVIATADLETIEWIEEKIQAAIDYHNETKGLFGSLDDV